jgi:isoquinoline 1-oxidoreductase beta subunit
VVSVADPGQVYDPEISAAGIEGGIVFGLSTITKDEILFANGGPKNVNFTDYDVVRMKESLKVRE